MLRRLVAFAPLLCASAMRNAAVPRRQLLGGAVAAGATLAPPAIAAPDWLQDVPTESADEAFAATRSERLGQAPSATAVPLGLNEAACDGCEAIRHLISLNLTLISL